MRKLYFLVPGLGGKFACGGLFAELKTLTLAQQICQAEAVTYRQREPNTPFLNDVLQKDTSDRAIFVISWGFDIPKLAARLKGYPVVYHAHSAGYGFQIPPSIPIITVSRNTLGYWGQIAPHSLLYYLPNQISDEFTNQNLNRDIDVLVQVRKSSHYLLNELIPELKQHCNVFVVDSFVDNLPALFNRAKVYLYDSAEYWAIQRVSEGFGLQPMEAMACGCQVFSSVNGGLSDYLDPGFNCYKIAGYSRDFDVQRILHVVKSGHTFDIPNSLFEEYRTANIVQRFSVILNDINLFFDQKAIAQYPIPPLTPLVLMQRSLSKTWSKVQSKLQRKR
ncbi:glycosyltransferase [Leptolyngbya sp. AN02str]|uniref:glycosyltransferase n=1 Tax=Leptolyngbya sp. AN02str TaxID=3423363 RepID=UPI003D30FA87